MDNKKDGFRFPKHIVYLGRLMTALRISRKHGLIVCVYEDDELGVRTSFTATQFMFGERYGHIERRYADGTCDENN